MLLFFKITRCKYNGYTFMLTEKHAKEEKQDKNLHGMNYLVLYTSFGMSFFITPSKVYIRMVSVVYKVCVNHIYLQNSFDWGMRSTKTDSNTIDPVLWVSLDFDPCTFNCLILVSVFSINFKFSPSNFKLNFYRNWSNNINNFHVRKDTVLLKSYLCKLMKICDSGLLFVKIAKDFHSNLQYSPNKNL